jgi:putative copper export protein/mono/diheme cytochrome c family protein
LESILIEPLVAARAVHFAAMMMLEGAIVFRFLIADPILGAAGGEEQRVLRRLLAWTVWLGLLVGVVSGAAWLILLAGRIRGLAPAATVSQGVAWIVLTQTRFGETWQVRSVLAGLLTASMLALNRGYPTSERWFGAVSIILAGSLVGALAWAGHGAATPDAIGDVQLIADVSHLIAAGIWIGGLGPLTAMLLTARRQGDVRSIAIAAEATRCFSVLGVGSVLTLLVTGMINTYVLAGSVPALVGTPYGRLLLIKIGLFITMVSIAAFNRQGLTPRLVSVPAAQTSMALGALAALVRNSLAELGLGLAILVVFGALGILIPGLHDQPVWPFPVRFSTDALGDPQLRNSIFAALAAIVLSALLVVGAVLWRRLRWPGITCAVLLIGYFAPTLRELTEPAYPTSFYGSPTGYSAQSIARGQSLFLENCAACHGPQGRGDGPAGRSFTTKPADLTAEHIYGHPGGDIFWWITRGKNGLMPAFGDVLDENARWNLIDFIHANADAVRLRAAAGQVTTLGYPVPAFSIECPDGSVLSINELKGQVLHLVFAGAQATDRLQALAGFEANGVKRILVLPSNPSNTDSTCIASEPDVLQMLALYRGASSDTSLPTEWLVDAVGSLRAIWYPGNGESWHASATLKQRLDDIKRIPAVARAAGEHAHHH